MTGPAPKGLAGTIKKTIRLMVLSMASAGSARTVAGDCHRKGALKPVACWTFLDFAGTADGARRGLDHYPYLFEFIACSFGAIQKGPQMGSQRVSACSFFFQHQGRDQAVLR